MAAAEFAAALANHRVVAVGHLQDELVRTREPGRLHHCLHAQTGVSQRNVVAHTAIEEQGVLPDHANLAPQPGGVDQIEVHAVNQDAPALRAVQALDQPHQRRLASAGYTHQAEHLAGFDIKTQVAQNLGRFGCVAKVHVLKTHAPLHIGRRRAIGPEAGLRWRVHDVAQAPDADLHLREVLPQGR